MKTQKKKQKQQKWFIKVRGSYLPCSWQGWLTYIPYAGYLIVSYAVIVSRATSNTTIAFELIPQWIAATIIMTWLAHIKS